MVEQVSPDRADCRVGSGRVGSTGWGRRRVGPRVGRFVNTGRRVGSWERISGIRKMATRGVIWSSRDLLEARAGAWSGFWGQILARSTRDVETKTTVAAMTKENVGRETENERKKGWQK
ncbi:hypothetical protein PIB30_007368 [Stylosanthes scabra]|uniref:Uncharacterized protein n=1 Tax=Stylosanthes scabra TaxID=79078 RepID=A0ABU6Z2E2_9FABA|nr:hypothetical protein [Stylosanthes scabra]